MENILQGSVYLHNYTYVHVHMHTAHIKCLIQPVVNQVINKGDTELMKGGLHCIT